MITREPLAKVAEINPAANGAMRLPRTTPVSFLPMSAVSEDGYVLDEQERPVGEVLKGYTAFRRGDILVAKITPCMENGKAAHLDKLGHEYGFGSTEFHVVRPGPEIDGRYLFFMLWNPAFRRQAGMNMTGSAGQKRVPAGFVERFSIPVPDTKSEQRRVADILDEANALRRKRAEAIRLVDSLSTALFIEQVGDPIRNPNGWRMSTFGEELADLEYGPRFYNESYTPDGVRIVRITDLDAAGNLDFDSMPRLEVEPAVKAARCLKPGDIILARSGATVGKSALIKEGSPECIAGAYFIRLQFKKSVRPQYVKMLLDTKPIQTIIAQRSVQSAQQNFSGPGIRALPLPVPPDEIQLRVEAAMAEREAILQKMVSSRAELDNLFHSLLQRAFRGDL